MKKCIKTKDGAVERVKEKEAELRVRKGDAVYTTKSAWCKTDSDWEKRSAEMKKAAEKRNKMAGIVAAEEAAVMAKQGL